MSSLEAIVSLQKTRQELKDAHQRLDTIPDWMQELHEEHSSRKTEIDSVQEQRDATEKARRLAEAALSDAQEKLKHFQEQIGKVSTQREYGALLKEIDTVKEQISNFEQEALEALEKSDEMKSQLETMESDFQDLDQRYSAELEKWESEKPSVRQRVEELEGQSAKLKGEIPKNYLMLFERIYDRLGGVAVSRIGTVDHRGANTMWHCEACNYNVRPQVVVQLRAGNILQCEGCKRILFWEDEAADEDGDGDEES